MKTIVLDTGALAQMVSLVAQANEEIDEAADLMNKVVSHNEWTCKERALISEGIMGCKKAISALQDSTRVFLNAFNHVLDDMVKKESGISKSFQGVESVLAKLLGAGLGTAGIGKAISATGKIVSDIPHFQSEWKPKLIDWQSGIWDIVNDVTPPHFPSTIVSSGITRDCDLEIISIVSIPTTTRPNWTPPLDVNIVLREAIDNVIRPGRPNYGDTNGLPPGVVPIAADLNESIYDAANFVETINPVDFQTVLIGMSES